MQSVSPVFTKEETQFEFEIGKDQAEYVSVIGLPVTLRILDPKTGDSKEIPNWAIAARFRLSPEERAQVAAGLDLVVTQLTFGKPLAPMNFQLCPAATKPIFEVREEEPISNVVAMPAASVPDATGLSDANQPDYTHCIFDGPHGECSVCGGADYIHYDSRNETEQPAAAGSQCACGHEEHSGTCGKPRYSSGDPCLCNTFIDTQNHPQLEV